MNQELVIFVEQLKKDFSELKIREGKKFMFRPPKTIFYEKNVNWGEGGDSVVLSEKSEQLNQNTIKLYKMQLLHELGHAMLGHAFFATDLERLKMERAAWDEAIVLGKRYGVEFDEELIEDKLDTYRDWLHQRSKCKRCGMTGYQTKDGKYHCPFCSKT